MACVASDALISGIDIDWSTPLSGHTGTEGTLELVKQGFAWQRLEKEECIGQSFASDHGSVLAIVSALSAGELLKLQLNTLSHIAPGVSPDSDTGWCTLGYALCIPQIRMSEQAMTDWAVTSIHSELKPLPGS